MIPFDLQFHAFFFQQATREREFFINKPLNTSGRSGPPYESGCCGFVFASAIDFLTFRTVFTHFPVSATTSTMRQPALSSASILGYFAGGLWSGCTAFIAQRTRSTVERLLPVALVISCVLFPSLSKRTMLSCQSSNCASLKPEPFRGPLLMRSAMIALFDMAQHKRSR